MGKPICVEIAIQAPLEELWRLTRSPDLHKRWDLRFTRIARYRGWFTAEWPSCSRDAVPPHVRPGQGGTA